MADWVDGQLAALRPNYPGWDIWFVPCYPVGVTWCARPAGHPVATINVSTPEDLIAEIRRQEESPTREHDVGDLATSELQRVYRELVTSAALAVPSSGARVMILKKMEAIDAELARRGAASPGQLPCSPLP